MFWSIRIPPGPFHLNPGVILDSFTCHPNQGLTSKRKPRHRSPLCWWHRLPYQRQRCARRSTMETAAAKLKDQASKNQGSCFSLVRRCIQMHFEPSFDHLWSSNLFSKTKKLHISLVFRNAPVGSLARCLGVNFNPLHLSLQPLILLLRNCIESNSSAGKSVRKRLQPISNSWVAELPALVPTVQKSPP